MNDKHDYMKKQYKIRMGEVCNSTGHALDNDEIVDVLNQQITTIQILEENINGLRQTLWVRGRRNRELEEEIRLLRRDLDEIHGH